MSITVIYTALQRILGAKTKENLEELAKKFKLVGGTRSKYNNLKVYYNKDIYDSLSEAYYAYKLDKLTKDKVISGYERQVKYPLKGRHGSRSLHYKADFVVTAKSGSQYIIDIKGRILPEANIKLAYFEYVYQKPVHLVMTSGPEKFDTSFIV